MDYLKKLVHLGFGAWSLTREKAEEIVSEMVKKGEISSQESKKWVDELLNKIDEGKKEAESKIEKIVEATLKKLRIPLRSEIDNLTDQVNSLKTEIEALSKKIKEPEDKN